MLDSRSSTRVDYDIAIIGAGFGGVIAALQFRSAGRKSFVIFERASEPGGVWRDNLYPGCACDIRSNLYSIATEPNPAWTSTFAPQWEILNYLKEVIARNGLVDHLQCGVEIIEARFLEAIGCWLLTDQRGAQYRVRVLILAAGSHNRPLIPAIAGKETFQGPVFHSSRWDHTVELTGKRVAVIGTGASAIQIVPGIAANAGHLDVFQRTPAWVLPRGDLATSLFKRRMFARLPLLQRLERALVYWILEFTGLAFHGNKPLHRLMTWVAMRKLAKDVRDPQVRRKLAPEYKLGCKRVVLSDDYYTAFNQSNVTLHTDAIREITPDGIVTADGELHAVDAIVFATGFLVTEMQGCLPIFGRSNKSLRQIWDEEGMQAYRGIHVSGFPNLALLMGPNSALGHSSVLHVMESQMRYVLSWLDALDRTGDAEDGAYFDVLQERQRSYNGNIQRGLRNTVWSSGCKSWYLDRHGRNSTVFPGLTFQYRRATAKFYPDDYELVRTVG